MTYAPTIPTIVDFVHDLHLRGVRLQADGDALDASAPPGVLDNALVRQLAARKPELLTFLRSAQAALLAAPRRVRRTGDLPLSFAQERLWFLDQLEPDSPLYNMPAALRVEGEGRMGALCHALAESVRRHEVLRTCLPSREGRAVQHVVPNPQFCVPRVDLTGLPAGLRDAVTARLSTELGRRPFDLARGPLVRSALVRQASASHVVLVAMHHVVSDGWSIAVLTEELGELYAAFATGKPSRRGELRMQYADYAVWQRRWLSGAELARQVGYWKNELAGAPPVLDLPTDRPRPPTQTFRGATHCFALSPAVTAKLTALAQRENATLFMIFLAALHAVLMRHTGQYDVSIGTPIAGRRRHELEPLVGFFVNTLVLRARGEGDPTFRELLATVRRTTLAGYEHQDLPFEKLVEELQPQRSLSTSPLFQVMLVLQNLPGDRLELPGLTLRAPEDADSGIAKFDLMWVLREGEGGVQARLEYNADLFDRSTAVRLSQHWERVLSSIGGDVEQRLSALPLESEAERAQALVEWNDTSLSPPVRANLCELFASQAARTPDKVALVFEDEHVTYGALHRRVDALARRLAGEGVGPETLVGVATARTPAMLVAMMAILRAGGAYVPLDPSYPSARLAGVIADVGLHLVVSDGSLIDLLARAGVVVIDALGALDEQPAPPIALTPPRPESLAYLIYTSGSTGRPKSVALTHDNAVAFVGWMARAFPELGGEAVLASTSTTFDLSVFELLGTLALGATVVLVQNALELATAPARDRVTVINTVPSAITELLASRAIPPSVRIVNLAGEPLGQRTALALYDLRTVEHVYDLYGPSEDTTYSTYTRRGRSDIANIGRPLLGKSAALVDRRSGATPAGAPGLLRLWGAGHGRGYVNRPHLTAERFVPWHGTRAYDTGDLARRLPDGRLVYRGRVDHQVKIRGFRIELGEIEVRLSSHPDVRDVVVVRDEGAGEARLVAYVVPAPGASPTVEALRGHMASTLPSHMVPAIFVFLDALPLTTSGKVNRSALPAPHERQGVEAAYVAPRDATEASLAAIWSEALAMEKVGVEDDFFALGGSSLLAVRLVHLVRARTGLPITIRDLMAGSTVAELARRMTGASGGLGAVDDMRTRLLEDAALESLDVGALTAPSSTARHVLLTGATGFLGAFLCEQLVSSTDATIYALVRAGDAAEATRRLRQSLMDLGAWQPSMGERVEALPSDLSKPALGLAPDVYDRLTRTVDTVIHSAADTNIFSGYDACRKTNVLGTRALLRFATTARLKAFHHVSTSSVATSEELCIPLPENPSGYVQSKWVAEQLVVRAHEQGVPVAVYRVPRLLGHSLTGACNVKDLVVQVITAMVELRSAPELDLRIAGVPVDVAAGEVLRLSRSSSSFGKAFVLTMPPPIGLQALIDGTRRHGYAIATKRSAEDWVAQLDGKHKGLRALFETAATFEGDTGDDAPAGILDQPWWQRNLQFLASKGVLPAMRRGASDGR